MSYNQQLTIYIEENNSYSIYFSYNQNTTFQDLFEFIIYSNPEKNICPCYKMQYYHNSNSRYYDLSLNENVYNYINNNSYKQYNIAKKNQRRDEHEGHKKFFNLSKFHINNILNKYMRCLEKEINNFSEIKNLNKIELVDYDEAELEEHKQFIDFLNSIFYDKGYNNLIQKFNSKIQEYEEEIKSLKEKMNELEKANQMLTNEINGDITVKRINELSKLGITQNLKPRQNLIRLDPKTNQIIGNEASIKDNLSNFYDIIIDIKSMKSICRGWEIKKSKRISDNYEQFNKDKVIVIGVIGNSNKGKSFLLSKISKVKDIPSGTSIRTEGLSIKYPELDTFQDRKIVLLDSAGLETPVLNDEEEGQNKEEENNTDDKELKTKEDNKPEEVKENNEGSKDLQKMIKKMIKKDKKKEENQNKKKKMKKDNKNNDNIEEKNESNDENENNTNENELEENKNEQEKTENNDKNKNEDNEKLKDTEEKSKNKVENQISDENKKEISEKDKINGKFKENSRDKLITEIFLQNYIMNYSDILIIVVGILTYSEQKLLCKIKNEILNYKERKPLFIIHNLMTYTTIEQVEDYISNCLLKSSTFSLELGHKISTKTQKKTGVYYYENNVNTKIFHLIFANEGSEAGNYYNNLTLEFIENSYQGVINIKSFDAIQSVKEQFIEISKEIIENPEKPLTLEFDNTNENYIKLINPKKITLKCCSINELGISNLVSNGFEPTYNLYKKDNKIILKIEAGGNSTILNANILFGKGENTYLIVAGEKKKDKEPQNSSDNIKNSRKFGKFYLEIPIIGDYIIKNEDPKIFEKKGILFIEYNLDEKIGGGKYELEEEI